MFYESFQKLPDYARQTRYSSPSISVEKGQSFLSVRSLASEVPFLTITKPQPSGIGMTLRFFSFISAIAFFCLLLKLGVLFILYLSDIGIIYLLLFIILIYWFDTSTHLLSSQISSYLFFC